MSLKGLFPEVSRELQVPAPWMSASQRGLPTRVPNTASAGHGHTHMGTGWITADFTWSGTKKKCFSCTIQICMRRSHASHALLVDQGPELPPGQQVDKLLLAPCHPYSPQGGEKRRLWVWKEEKQSSSLIENKLCKERFLDSCASLSTHYLPAGPAVRAQWLS